MQSVPGSLATAESVGKDLCISSARQSHKLQWFHPQTVAEERNSEAKPNFYFFKSLSLPHLQATSSILWFSSTGISLDNFLNTWEISIFSSCKILTSPGAGSYSFSTAFSPAGLLGPTASLKHSHNSPQISACLQFIPSFLPLLSPRYMQLKRIVV